MRRERDAAARRCLCDTDVAALHRGRRSRIVVINHLRMSAVVVDGKLLRILLEDGAARCLCRTAVEVRDAALADIGSSSACTGRRARTDILVVLIIARVASLVRPQGTILHIEVCRAAVVDEAVQGGARRREGNVQSARRQSEEIAVEPDVLRAGRRAVRARIHVDRALIGGERVVAVLHACRHLNRAAADLNAAVRRVRRHAVSVDGHIDIPRYGNIALFDLRQDAGVVEAREYILTVERDAPLIGRCPRNLQIVVDADAGGSACLIGLLPAAIALLHSDAIAAKAACHGDVDGRVDGDPGRLVLRCIKLDSVRQRSAPGKASRDDIDLVRIHRDILAVSCIDARRIADGVLRLKLQHTGCLDRDIIRPRIDSGENVCLGIAELLLADADDGITAKIPCLRDRVRKRRAALPYGFIVCCRRCCENHGCRIAVDLIRLKHCDLVEARECLVGGEIFRLPFVSFRVIAILIGAQCIAELKPEALRIVLGIELAEPAFLILNSDNISPRLRIIGEQIRYSRLIDMRTDFAARRTEVVRHDIGRTVGQDLEIAHILTCCRHIGRQFDAALFRADQFAAVVDLCDAEGSIMRVSRPVIVLIAADARDEEMIVEAVEPALVDIAADARIAAEFQRAVILDVVLHQEAVVVGVIAAERVDGCRHIELFPHGEQRLAVHRRLCGIARIGHALYAVLVLVKVLEGFREVIAAVFLDVLLEVDGCRTILKEFVADTSHDADLAEIVARHIDMGVRTCRCVRIRDGEDFAARHSCCSTLGVWIDEEIPFKLRRTVRVLAQKHHALAGQMQTKGGRITVQILQHAGMSFGIDMRRHARACHSPHLAVAVVGWDGRDEVCCRRS